MLSRAFSRSPRSIMIAAPARRTQPKIGILPSSRFATGRASTGITEYRPGRSKWLEWLPITR